MAFNVNVDLNLQVIFFTDIFFLISFKSFKSGRQEERNLIDIHKSFCLSLGPRFLRYFHDLKLLVLHREEVQVNKSPQASFFLQCTSNLTSRTRQAAVKKQPLSSTRPEKQVCGLNISI